MTTLKLPNVTLITCSGKDKELHEETLIKSSEGIEFGDVRLVWEPEIKSIDDWNYFVTYRLYHYVHTELAILIHPDGYVIRPDLWRPEWLKLDFIGSPWPLPTDDNSYRDFYGNIQRVGNSVSLRSKRLMEFPDRTHMLWQSYYGNTNEDGFICVHNRHLFEKAGMKFGTFEQALHFGKEAPLLENENLDTFLFHHYG